MHYCLVHTECKLIIIDPERADKLERIAKKLVAEAGCTGILVLESHEGKDGWEGMKTWEAAFDDYKGDPRQILNVDPGLVPEDDATILFTSGSVYDLSFEILSLKGSNKSFVRDNGQTQGGPQYPSTISHKFVECRHLFNLGSEGLMMFRQVMFGGRRAALRRGDNIPAPPVGPQKGILLSVPLFHVTGLTSLTVRMCLANGPKCYR